MPCIRVSPTSLSQMAGAGSPPETPPTAHTASFSLVGGGFSSWVLPASFLLPQGCAALSGPRLRRSVKSVYCPGVSCMGSAVRPSPKGWPSLLSHQAIDQSGRAGGLSWTSQARLKAHETLPCAQTLLDSQHEEGSGRRWPGCG